MAKTRERVADTAESVRPYLERALKDEGVRDDVKNALAAARDVYTELLGGRSVTHVATRVATDKDIQENLKTAIDDLRHAADRIQGKDEHRARNMLLLTVGIALGALFNPMTGPATRRWVTDRLFGSSGDDFGYQPNSSPGTMPSEPFPPPASSEAQPDVPSDSPS